MIRNLRKTRRRECPGWMNQQGQSLRETAGISVHVLAERVVLQGEQNQIKQSPAYLAKEAE